MQTIWLKICGHLAITPLCSCLTFHSKPMGINKELVPLFGVTTAFVLLGRNMAMGILINQPQEH